MNQYLQRFWTPPIAELLQHLRTTIQGLREDEAQKRLTSTHQELLPGIED
jgi:hypothetical protein